MSDNHLTVVDGAKGLTPELYVQFWGPFGGADKSMIEALVLDYNWVRSYSENPQMRDLRSMSVAMLQGIGEEIDEYDDLDGCMNYVELLARDHEDPAVFRETVTRLIDGFEEHYARHARPFAEVLNSYATEIGLLVGPQSQEYEMLAVLPHHPQTALDRFMSFETYFDYLQNIRVTLGLEQSSAAFPKILPALGRVLPVLLYSMVIVVKDLI